MKLPASLLIRQLLLVTAAFCLACILPACNTVDGAGKDVENLGEAVQDAAD